MRKMTDDAAIRAAWLDEDGPKIGQGRRTQSLTQPTTTVMGQTGHLLPLVAILFAGCASVPKVDLNADYPEERAQIQRVLSEVFEAAEKKDLDRLDGYHFYGPKFTKFAGEQPGRQDATAARWGEHEGLESISDLSMRADGLKVDVFGEVGLATFVLDYHFKAGTDTLEKKARATMVFVKERGAWKIVHEHFSAIKSSP